MLHFPLGERARGGKVECSFVAATKLPEGGLDTGLQMELRDRWRHVAITTS